MTIKKIKFLINEYKIVLRINDKVKEYNNNYITLFKILNKTWDIKDIDLYTKRDEKFIITVLMLKKKMKKKYGDLIKIEEIGLEIVEEFLKLYKIYYKLKNNKNKYYLKSSNGWYIRGNQDNMFKLLTAIANKLILEELRYKQKYIIELGYEME
jgi:hypothetical protein